MDNSSNALVESNEVINQFYADIRGQVNPDTLDLLPQGKKQQLANHLIEIRNIISDRCDTSVTIRTSQPGDAGYIAYRHGVLYAREYGLDQVFEKYVFKSLITYLEQPAEGELWIAERCGVIIGFIGVVKTTPASAQLRWFLIEPEFRGSGLGHKLVAKVLEYCKKEHCNHVFLWTFQGLDAARHLYEQCGFSLTEEKENNTWKKQLIEQRWDLYLVD
jgi:GNAT superfamily N-acetyltransferase